MRRARRATYDLSATADDFARFWAKTRVDGDCIVWVGGTARGYGAFSIRRNQVVASRWIYMQVAGVQLPTTIFVMHTCDNPKCVKPQHLTQGTPKQNIEDALNKDRIARGDELPQAKLTEDDVRMIRRLLAVKVSRTKIALCFGVSRALIIQIARGEIWAHVAPT